MRIGLQVNQSPQVVRVRAIEGIARAAEDAGLSALWLSDHLVLPVASESRYPYGDGRIPFEPSSNYLECVSTMAFLVGVTRSIEVGALLVLPMREVLSTAKSLATIDALSGGRTAVAFAAGWWREEFDALGQDFDTRGARMDEQLAAVQALWRIGRDQRDGVHLRYREVTMLPRPAAGRPATWVAGSGPAAWRRVASSEAGWYGVGHEPTTIRNAIASINAACAQTGRTSAVPISVTTGLPGDSQRAAARLGELEQCGVTQVVFILRESDDDAARRAIRLLSTLVAVVN